MDLPHQAVASAVFGIPRVPRAAVRRPRLDHRIDELLDTCDAVIVRGPAGAGKTVALAEWAAARSARDTVSWIALDQQHTGRTQFWREVVYGLAARIAPEGGDLLERCLAALDAGVDPRTVLARFTPLIPPTIVVVDRAELIAAELFDDMVWVIQHNRHLKGVFASRRRTPLESARMALALDVGVLDGAELELTAEETAQMLGRLGSRLDPERLHTAAGGSPLLTRAAAEAAQHSPGLTADEAAREAVADLFDYRAAEAAVGSKDLGFMARTALPESLTAELAISLSGRDDAVALFDRFEERGWGMWSGAGGRARFRYGSAIRTALLEAARHLDPRELDAARRTVIDHDLAAGNLMGALRGAVEISDLDLASAIAQRHHITLLSSEPEAVVALLECVPLISMRRHPVLVMALALCLNATPGGQARAAELFLLAAACSRVYRGSVSPGQKVWLLTLESAALRFAGNLELALRQARRAVQAFEEAPQALREELAPLEPTLYTQAGIAHLIDGDYALAGRLLAHAAEASRRAHHTVGEFHATALLALCLARAGRMKECREVLARLREGTWPPGLEQEYWATPYRLAQAREAISVRRYEDAAARMAAISEEMRVSEFWPQILVADVYLGMIARGDRPGIATLEALIKDAARAPLTSARRGGAGLAARRRAPGIREPGQGRVRPIQAPAPLPPGDGDPGSCGRRAEGPGEGPRGAVRPARQPEPVGRAARRDGARCRAGGPRPPRSGQGRGRSGGGHRLGERARARHSAPARRVPGGPQCPAGRAPSRVADHPGPGAAVGIGPGADPARARGAAGVRRRRGDDRGDRRAPERLGEHGQVPDEVPVPQARGISRAEAVAAARRLRLLD